MMLIRPSPKLPTRSEPATRPQPLGTVASPGAFSLPPEAMREIRWPWVLTSDAAPACKAHEPLEHYTSLLKLRQLRVAMRNRICADRADSHARYT